MAVRKKNQKLDMDIEPNVGVGGESDEMPNRSDEPAKREQSMISDLEMHQESRHQIGSAVRASVAAGLIFGLLGGVFGAIYGAPWYQKNILRQTPVSTTAQNQKIILDEESAIINAVDKVNPAVVSIVISKDLPKLEQFASPFGGFYFTAPSGQTQKQNIGAGSGFIISSDGLIVTNRHVVEDASADYTVVTKDGQKYTAKILATDPFNDLAMVKIEAKDLPTVTLGDSDKLKLGQRVIAIGNALGQFQNTVTTGVVSGIDRNISASGGAQSETLSEVIQTDAAINPGNSGGPLIDLEGDVIGVNTAVSQDAQLIGFAIPVNQAKKVITDVQQFGKVRRPFLGVRYTIVNDGVAADNKLSVNYGALIVKGDNPNQPAVVPGSPAEQAGLAEGDIILELDGQQINQDKTLSDILLNYNPGDRVLLKVQRQGQEKNVSVTLGEAQ